MHKSPVTTQPLVKYTEAKQVTAIDRKADAFVDSGVALRAPDLTEGEEQQARRETEEEQIAAAETEALAAVGDYSDGDGSDNEESDEDSEQDSEGSADDVNSESEGDASNEDEEDEEEDAENSLATPQKPRRVLSRREEAQLRVHLLRARPLIEVGIVNASCNEVSSADAMAPNIDIPGLESIVPLCLPHQLDGAGRYEAMMRKNGGVLLGDDMGLGKTWIILLVLQRAVGGARSKGKSVLYAVAVPKALVSSWRAQLGRSTTMRTGVYSDPNVRNMSAAEIKRAYDVLIISFGTITYAYGRLLQTYIYRQAQK